MFTKSDFPKFVLGQDAEDMKLAKCGFFNAFLIRCYKNKCSKMAIELEESNYTAL